MVKKKSNINVGSSNFCRMPGKAYAKRKHVWLSSANEVDSKTFSRAILAKVIKFFYSFTNYTMHLLLPIYVYTT